jgi:hypothetical protein
MSPSRQDAVDVPGLHVDRRAAAHYGCARPVANDIGHDQPQNGVAVHRVDIAPRLQCGSYAAPIAGRGLAFVGAGKNLVPRRLVQIALRGRPFYCVVKHKYIMSALRHFDIKSIFRTYSITHHGKTTNGGAPDLPNGPTSRAGCHASRITISREFPAISVSIRWLMWRRSGQRDKLLLFYPFFPTGKTEEEFRICVERVHQLPG